MSLFERARPLWATGANRKSPVRDRFLAKVRPIPGKSCWGWVGYVTPNGYGMVGDGRRVTYAHRLAYELYVGPIPPGLHIDHLCRERRCVRPDHLEAVTQAENNRRAWVARRAEAS